MKTVSGFRLKKTMSVKQRILVIFQIHLIDAPIVEILSHMCAARCMSAVHTLGRRHVIQTGNITAVGEMPLAVRPTILI